MLCATAAVSFRLGDFADPALIAWVLAIALVDLFPVPTWGGATFTSNEPLWVAAMIVFPPHVACAIAFIGFLDPREFRGEISAQRGLFNRGQTVLAAGMGSLLFHALADVHDSWLLLVPAAVLAAASYSALNVSFVAVAMSLQERTPVRRTARGLLMDSPRDWFLGYLCFGLLGVVIARLFAESGSVWVVGLSALPLMVLGRGALLHVRLARQEVLNALEREARVRSAAERAAAERKDERMQLAATLHDDAIPTLQGVNLLATAGHASLGAPDQIREIFGEIRAAADSGSAQLRKIVSELRSTDLGEGGLAKAISRLVQEEGSKHPSTSIDVRIDEDDLPREVQALLYQIAREALANALTHSDATNVQVSIAATDEGCVLKVIDNGDGFDPADVRADHFGLLLMRERAEAMSGRLEIQSGPSGTSVQVRWHVPH